jgi:hypothetical protein
LSRGFDPAGHPTKPLVSYQSLPTTLRVASSSTGVPRRRGALNKTGYMRTMKRLRVVAIGSNVAFITYSFGLHLRPIFVLHIVLLFLNAWRLWQIYLTDKTDI